MQRDSAEERALVRQRCTKVLYANQRGVVVVSFIFPLLNTVNSWSCSDAQFMQAIKALDNSAQL